MIFSFAFLFLTIVFTVPFPASSRSPELSLNAPDLAHLHSSRAANHRGRSAAQSASIQDRERERERERERGGKKILLGKNITVNSLTLQGRPKKQISFVGARWLLAAVGDAAHAFVFMRIATNMVLGLRERVGE